MPLRFFSSNSSYHETRKGHSVLFCPSKQKSERNSSEKRESQKSWRRLERGHVMKVRALTQRGKFQSEEDEEEG